MGGFVVRKGSSRDRDVGEYTLGKGCRERGIIEGIYS